MPLIGAAPAGAVERRMGGIVSQWRLTGMPMSVCPPTTPTALRLSIRERSERDARTLALRAREAAGPWLATLAPWSLYVTLTYDPARWYNPISPPSSWSSSRHLVAWHAAARKLLQRPVFSVAALEYHRSGWPHWHGLLATGGISGPEFASLSDEWFSAHGYARFERVRPGTEAVVAAYCAKYLVKRSSDVLFLGSLVLKTPAIQCIMDFRGGQWRPPGGIADGSRT